MYGLTYSTNYHNLFKLTSKSTDLTSEIMFIQPGILLDYCAKGAMVLQSLRYSKQDIHLEVEQDY